MNPVSSVLRGTAVARVCRSLAAGKGDPVGALGYAQAQPWRDTPIVVEALKAAVTPLGTSDYEAGTSPIGYDLAELLRPLTIVGKLTGVRRVPFNIRTLAQTAGAGVAWVGQGAPKPVGKLAYDAASSMTWAKVAGIIVATQELLTHSDPQADGVISTDLGSAVAAFMDAQFISPTVAAVPNVSPASITSGLSARHSTGSTVDAIDADLKAMLQVLLEAQMPLAAPYWIMNPRTATALALKRGTSGAPAYPSINARGGSLVGIPVITSSAVSVDYGSPSASYIVLVDASEILLADDGQGSIDLATDASLQMDSAPSAGAQPLVSLWQNNLVALKAERYINWKVRRAGAVALMDGVAY